MGDSPKWVKSKKRRKRKKRKKERERERLKNGPLARTSKTHKRNPIARVDKTLYIDLKNLPGVILVKEAVDGENCSDVSQGTEQCVRKTLTPRKEVKVFDDNIIVDDCKNRQNLSLQPEVSDNMTDTTVKEVHDHELNFVDFKEIEENDSITEVFDGVKDQNICQGNQLFVRKTQTQRKQIRFFVNDMIVEDI